MPKINAFPTLERSYRGGNQILVQSNRPIILRDNGIPYGNNALVSNLWDFDNFIPFGIAADTSPFNRPYSVYLEEVLTDTAITFPSATQVETNTDLIAANLAVAGVNVQNVLGICIIKDADVSADEDAYFVVAVSNGGTTNSVATLVNAITGVPASFTATSGTAKFFNLVQIYGAGKSTNCRDVNGLPGTGGTIDNISNEGGNYSQMQQIVNRATISSQMIKIENNPDTGKGYSADVPLYDFDNQGNHGDIRLTQRTSDPTGLSVVGTDNGLIWYNDTDVKLKLWDSTESIPIGEKDIARQNFRIKSITAAGGATPITTTGFTLQLVSAPGGSGGSTITATPSIVGTDLNFGDIIILWGNNDADPLTIQDNSNLAGSNVYLRDGNDITLGQDDFVIFTTLNRFSSMDFFEIGRSESFWSRIGTTTTLSNTGDDLIIEGLADPNLFKVDYLLDSIGIGVSTPVKKIEVDVPSADGMIVNHFTGLYNRGFEMHTQVDQNVFIIYEEPSPTNAYPSVYITIDPTLTGGYLSYVDYVELVFDHSNSFGFGVDSAVLSSDHDIFISGLNTNTYFQVSESASEFNFVGGDVTVEEDATIEKRTIFTPRSNQALVAANAIDVLESTVTQVSGSGGAVTLTSTPTIADGANGQMVILVGTDDTNTLTVQDDSNLAGSNLQLSGGIDFTLGQGDTLQLLYHSDTGDWVEISRSNN